MEPEQKLPQIRTFQGDMANAIDKQHESVVSIHRAEENRREAMKTLGPKETENPESEGSKRALIFALLTLILAGLGALGAYYAYITYQERVAPPIILTPPNQFISAAKVEEVDASTLSRQAVIGVLAIERSRERGASEITQINLLRGTEPGADLLDSNGLMTRLAVNASQPLLRAMGDMFMLGVLGSDPSHTFLIIEINSFENAFPGMLEWEARMAADILPLFTDEARLEEVPTATPWRDAVIQNRDTRVLKDIAGNTALIYAFFENKLLIITDNETSFRTIADRLESQKLTR